MRRWQSESNIRPILLHVLIVFITIITANKSYFNNKTNKANKIALDFSIFPDRKHDASAGVKMAYL